MGGAGYSASGGASAAKNGDQTFGSTTHFGGLNYGGEGVSPWLIGAIVIAAVYFFKK
jgi:hypothetical protein